MENRKLTLSVALISFNEEDNIARTLQSVSKIANEIIIVDSYSTDRTVEIARNFGAIVYQEEWKGYIEQKNSALRKCSQTWILALDCDEVPDETLLRSIEKAVSENAKFGYIIQRKTFYLGKLLKRSWQPDWKLRLVRRDCNPRWEGIEPHDKLVVDAPTKKLDGCLIHYSYRNVTEHFQKTIKYAKISAIAYNKMGKKANLWKLIVKPVYAFVRMYFLNLGIVDGIRGFFAAMSSSFATFLKYAFLWEIENSIK